MAGSHKLPQAPAEEGRQPQLFLRLWAPEVWAEHSKGEPAADAGLQLAVRIQPPSGRPLGISRVLGLLLASLRQEGLQVEGFNISSDQPESSGMSASAAAKALPLEAHGWEHVVENGLEAAEIRQKYYQELRGFAANTVDSCLRMRTQCLKEVDRLRQETQRLQRLLQQQQKSASFDDENSAQINVDGEKITFFHVDDFLPPSWDEIMESLDELRWRRSQQPRESTPGQVAHSQADLKFFASRFSRKMPGQAQAGDASAAGNARQDILTTDAAVQTLCESDEHPCAACAIDDIVAWERAAAKEVSQARKTDAQALVAEDVSSTSRNCNQTSGPGSKDSGRSKSKELLHSSPTRPRIDSIDECTPHSGEMTPGLVKTPMKTRPRPPVLMTPVANRSSALSVSHVSQTPNLALFPVSSSSHASKSSMSSLPLGAPSPAWGPLTAVREQQQQQQAAAARDSPSGTTSVGIEQRHEQATTRAVPLINGTAPATLGRHHTTGLPSSQRGAALDGMEQRFLITSPSAVQTQSALQGRVTSESVAVQWSPQNALQTCRGGRMRTDSLSVRSPQSARILSAPYATATPANSSPSAANWQSPTHSTVCKLPSLVPGIVPQFSQSLQPTLMAMTTPPARNHIVFKRPGRSWTTTEMQQADRVPQPPQRRNLQQASRSVQLAQRTAQCSRTWGGS